MISGDMTQVWTHQEGGSALGCTQSGSQLATEMLCDALTLYTVQPLR